MWLVEKLWVCDCTMTVACYYCNVAIPNNQAKRCSRCRWVSSIPLFRQTWCVSSSVWWHTVWVVIASNGVAHLICCPPNLLAPSQSKECQTLSWKASHKANCIPNPTVAALNGAKPEKFSTEWVELEIDKLLSKWMAEWRRCFMHWTMLALDLANHPPNRVVTHWYDNPATTPPIRWAFLVCILLLNRVISRPSPTNNTAWVIVPGLSPILWNWCITSAQVVDAAVVSFSQIQETFPELATEIDPTDFTRFRYVVTLQDVEGELRRVRLLQWNVRNLALLNKLPKDSAELAEGIVQVLMYSVEHMAPDTVERKFGLGIWIWEGVQPLFHWFPGDHVSIFYCARFQGFILSSGYLCYILAYHQVITIIEDLTIDMLTWHSSCFANYDSYLQNTIRRTRLIPPFHTREYSGLHKYIQQRTWQPAWCACGNRESTRRACVISMLSISKGQTRCSGVSTVLQIAGSRHFCETP